jgi:hypothetical protein
MRVADIHHSHYGLKLFGHKQVFRRRYRQKAPHFFYTYYIDFVDIAFQNIFDNQRIDKKYACRESRFFQQQSKKKRYACICKRLYEKIEYITEPVERKSRVRRYFYNEGGNKRYYCRKKSQNNDKQYFGRDILIAAQSVDNVLPVCAVGIFGAGVHDCYKAGDNKQKTRYIGDNDP